MAAGLKLPAVATLQQSPALLLDVDAAIAAAAEGRVCIDASALAEFDTSAIALLLHAQRAATAKGLAVQVDGAPSKLRELAQLYGVDALLPVGDAAATT